MNRILRLPLALAVMALAASPAFAAWPNQSALNLPVCTAANNQNVPTIVSDGAGGALITWQDSRSGNGDIYAQHVLASGAVDPAWPINGRALCTAADFQFDPMIISDGAGGAIVSWEDYRSGTADIYAHHVLASGAVDPAWPANGRPMCTAANIQSFPTIVSDGAGGAILTWQDLRGGSNYDIYAQHVLASGAVDPAWPLDGRALCVAANSQGLPTIVSDGAGGAIVTWQDARGSTNDIYAQRVLASGAVDPAWPLDGRALCVAANSQGLPTIVSDGAGGAIVTWQDLRGGSNYDIYAQHVLASGAVDPVWPANGRPLCIATNYQFRPTIVSDGAGGAIVTWDDLRSGSTYDIYAQHVLASGAVDPAWPIDGRALGTAVGDQTTPTIVGDGAGGAIVSWQDTRGGANDIYAQHVLASGTVDSAWPLDGRALGTATGSQQSPKSVTDGTGGAIVTWQDQRSGGNDIYAQRVARFGYLGTPEGELAGVKDVPNDNGGKVKVSWTASYLEFEPHLAYTYYYLFRSVPTYVAAQTMARGARLYQATEASLKPGDIVSTPAGSTTLFWELLTTVSGLSVPGYSYVASTTGDSLGTGNPKTLFMVQTRASTSFWNSQPDSGYSVDNLAPFAPAPFTANYVAGTAHLHWNPNTEPDLAGYRLYRGTSPSFVPKPATLIASPPDTGYADVSGAPYVYKLTAVDVHGNESPVATIIPTGTLGVGDGEPLALSFAAPSPNPARGEAALRYTLSRAGHVRLSVFDAAGRRVATLHDGEQTAGAHAASFKLSDAAGRELSSGLYLVQLEAEGRVIARRLATVR